MFVIHPNFSLVYIMSTSQLGPITKLLFTQN